MATSDLFLKLTDEDGDPLYIKSDLIAIYTKSEKTTIGSMLGEVRTVQETAPARGIISQSTGQWAVKDSYEEILAEMDRVQACESLV